MRVTISSLHPSRISQYIEANETTFLPYFDDAQTLKAAIAKLYKRQNGSTIVAGIKGLVKQSQYALSCYPILSTKSFYIGQSQFTGPHQR